MMIRFVALLSLFLWHSLASAELTIEITSGNDNPTRIAIVPFGWSGAVGSNEDMAGIVEADLQRSGLFRPLARSNMLTLPQQGSNVHFRNWRAVDVEYLLIGQISSGTDGHGFRVQFELFDVYKQERILFESASGNASQFRDLAHLISDKVYKALTGVPGAFSTKILYVSGKNLGAGRYNFRLFKADADGARPALILESPEPILSPAWSPDAKEVAYISFETGRAAIFRQVLATGQREQLTNYKGLNGAPAWSPDGRSMAMVLSKDGNPEIYIMDLASRKLTRVTNNQAIDTEPAWMPDGKSLVFTSNRGGQPQIYQQTLATGWVERLTFDGDYNARPEPLHDGRGLVLVHRHQGVFHIGVLDLRRGQVNILTETALDESPSIAPNSSMVMYATKRNGQGILAAVSLDGRVKFNLPSKGRDVREPSWSPFM